MLQIARHLMDLPIHEQPIVMRHDMPPNELEIFVGHKLWEALIYVKFVEKAAADRPEPTGPVP